MFFYEFKSEKKNGDNKKFEYNQYKSQALLYHKEGFRLR
jgi:hypothetical protein